MLNYVPGVVMLKLEIAFFMAFAICATIGKAAGGTALFQWVAPLFDGVSTIFLVAVVVYPVYGYVRLLLSPPPTVQWD